jgi:DNA-directed RNA polymerase specialized sigma24 family protein
MAALAGISRATDSWKAMHGVAAGRTGTGARFRAYWHVRGQGENGFERVEDHLALRQVWRDLPSRHQDALMAYSIAGTVPGAARLMGVPYTTYSSRLMTARNEARRLWFEPETAPGHWRKSYGPVSASDGRHQNPGRRRGA